MKLEESRRKDKRMNRINVTNYGHVHHITVTNPGFSIEPWILSFLSFINNKFSKKFSEFFPNNMQANEENEMKLILKKKK